ncbi:daunorubicin resistance protein DrrA family ABC transporter ATP-binding protein [Pyrinomonas methylaliphatogenes]|uniref:Daunorubicin resistance ABC transporter ATP-binding subunit n=1 Tax=Pyrinomonas methylaliphatogenes TaxID=454194 RepID=A0A0B6WX28_9BACT|nr:daunorubicin resistance protein DrrA family ABC transporter ATP-binding protein [Pyrinomonas methylaliphatogenes]CDM65848.1 daunorubicin resistance ABC transporter ATP-binding subunit [Pyrinomonas methylaliphatogenes]
MIIVKGLQKIYKQKRNGRLVAEIKAVDGIDFEVARGEFFGLLGPNGAGKTTTIGILTTRVLPTGGIALIDGIDVMRDPVAVKRRIGVVPQANNLDRSLTGRENLLFHAEYFGIDKRTRERRAAELLDLFQLSERADEKVSVYSGGMAQRLKIARALMHDPAILFLDEPTTGLDPQSRHALWQMLFELNARGQTIFLTTHYMEEADRLCQRVAIMDHGKLIALDTPSNLKRSVPGGYLIELRVRAAEELLSSLSTALRKLPNVVDVHSMDGLIRLYANRSEGLLADAVRLANERGVLITDAHVAEPSLETLFLHLTGRSLRE